jgi:hypothetical protein
VGAVVVLVAPALESDVGEVFPVAVLAGVAVGLAVELVLDAPVLDVVVEVLLTAGVLDTPGLAGVAGDFCVVVGVAAEACGASVCAKRMADETKLQTRIRIKRFMHYPFEDIEAAKVSRPGRQFKD